MQALERIGFGDSTVKGSALGQVRPARPASSCDCLGTRPQRTWYLQCKACCSRNPSTVRCSHTSRFRKQGRVLLFAYWLTFNILKSRKPKFQQLEEASDAPPAADAPAVMPSGECRVQCCCCGARVTHGPAGYRLVFASPGDIVLMDCAGSNGE